MSPAKQRFILPIEVVVQLMEESFDQGGSYDLTVTGTSMSPTLQPGRDQVRLVRANPREIRKRDILFARRAKGGYMLHRVLRVLPNGNAVLNGDGQVWTEEVAAGDILAVVTAFCRNGKWIPVDNRLYRTYVFFWGFTRPARNVMVSIKKKLTGMRRDGK